MKKNKLFLLGLFVVFAAVLSLSLVSNTLAKYTSSKTGSDSARVAKWGVVINVTDDGDSKNVLDTKDSNTEAEISVNQDKKLLAPGTKGQLLTVVVTGSPEVAVNVDVSFTLTLTGWEIGNPATEYMPLVFTAEIGGAAAKTYRIGDGAGEYANISALCNQLKTDIEDAAAGLNEGVYEEDTNLATTFDLVLSWKWAYEGENANDTALGNLAVAPTLGLEYSITITQID